MSRSKTCKVDTGPILNIPEVGLISRALALYQFKATDDTHRSQWKKIKGSFEMPKHVLCFFGQQGESFPGRRLTQQRQYSTVSSRHRGRADPPALTTLEKTCFAFWKPVLNNHCCEQMLCWRFSLWDHDSLYKWKYFARYVAHLVFSFVRLSHCSCQTMTDMSMHLISCQLCPFSVGNKCLEIFSSTFVGWFNIVDGVYFSAILQPIGRNPSSSDCDRVEFYQTSSLPGSPV